MVAKLKGRIVIFWLLTFFCFLGIKNKALADTAEVLPKGVFSASATTKFFLPVDERFDPDGNIEDAAADFNTILDSRVFPALAVFEGPPFNLLSASVGSSVVSFEYDVVEVYLDFAYGINDRLTVGVEIPYRWVKNSVEARLDTANATVGRNPFFGTPGDPFGVPLIPIAVGGTPLDTEDIQALLGDGLDVNGDGTVEIPGFGYKRFESWSDSGFLDIDVGARYQYFRNEDWRLALTGGVKLPTGDVDDPDNLVDVGFGKGAWGLFFHSNNDYTGIKNLVLNATFMYTLYLPDRETLRIPDNVNQPITINKEKVDRDIGDVIELETEAKYEFLKGANISLLYKFGHSFKDDISGNLGFAYESLEDETNRTEHIFIAGVSYSTVQLYMDRKFPLPLSAKLEYRNRFAGKNNVFKAEYIGVGLQVFF